MRSTELPGEWQKPQPAPMTTAAVGACIYGPKPNNMQSDFSRYCEILDLEIRNLTLKSNLAFIRQLHCYMPQREFSDLTV